MRSILAVLLLTVAVLAQPASLTGQRMLQKGGKGDDIPRALATDLSGNFYFAGTFTSDLESDKRALQSSGSHDIFLEKIERDGRTRWLVQAGGEGDDIALDNTSDNFGNCFLAGAFEKTLFFNKSHYLQAVGFSDAFLARYSTQGEVDWVISLGGAYQDFAAAVATDGIGNLLVAGSFENSALFGNKVLTGFGRNDIFVASLNGASGKVQWVCEAGGAEADFGWDVAVDAAGGYIYVTGEFRDTALLGGQALVSAGESDIFVLKLDSHGKTIWCRRFGGKLDDSGRKIVLGKDGNIYFTGSFRGQARFDGQQINSMGQNDVFVAKLSPAGTMLWAKRAGGAGSDEVLDLVLEADGNCLITGNFVGSAAFGETVLQAIGDKDLFVAALNSEGDFVRARGIGGKLNDSGWAVAVDRRNTLFLAGSFHGTLVNGDARLDSRGDSDGFLEYYVLEAGGAGQAPVAGRTGTTDFGVVSGRRDYEETISVATENKRFIKQCLSRLSRNNPTLKGYLVVRFLIHPAGHVVEGSIRVVTTDIQDVRLTRCILRNIARWRNFPEVESAMGAYPIVQKYIF